MLINFIKKGEKMKKQIIIYVTLVILVAGAIIGGFYLYRSFTPTPEALVTSVKVCNATDNGKTIIYQGKNNTTALDLLEKNCDIETSGTGESAFVTSINGTKANSANEFWSFEVNGEMASVGAGSYITKDSDTIAWKLSSF